MNQHSAVNGEIQNSLQSKFRFYHSQLKLTLSIFSIKRQLHF